MSLDKSEIPVGKDPQEPEGFGYADAEAVLSNWNYRSLPDGEEAIAAIDKGLQAIRDCLEMGLDGIGG